MNPARFITDMQKATPDAVGTMLCLLKQLLENPQEKKKPNHLIWKNYVRLFEDTI